MDKNTMDLLITIGIILFGIYELYKGIKQYVVHIKAKKEYMNNHQQNYETYKQYTLWAGGYGIAAIATFITAIYRIVVDVDYLYGAGFAMIGACAIGFMLDAIVKRSAWFYEDGFFFESTFHRYRTIAKVAPRNGLFPSYDVTITNSPSMVVTKVMGELLQKKIKENKRNKKKRSGDDE